MRKSNVILSALITTAFTSVNCNSNSNNTKINSKDTIIKTFDTIAVKEDVEPNYALVKIGDQIWMSENLNISKFRNGDTIPEANSDAEWRQAGEKKLPMWRYYDYNPLNAKKYGKQYNWYAVDDYRGFAPIGYHIPPLKDLVKLREYLGEFAGEKMKSTSGWEGNVFKGIDKKLIKMLHGGKGTNTSGFSGLDGGVNGAYQGDNSYWWGIEDIERPLPLYYKLEYSNGDLYWEYGNNYLGNIDYWLTSGMYVRCIKNDNIKK